MHSHSRGSAAALSLLALPETVQTKAHTSPKDPEYLYDL